MEFDSIEQQVVASLRALDEQSGQWSDKKATRKVKNAVGRLGDELGFKVHAASCRYDDIGEWLYDLCWCEQDELGLVLDMPLALECEWQSNLTAILDDFQKLLVSRAGHRVFLCSQSTAEDWEDCVEHLAEQIQLYRGTRDGDRYLLGCWTSDGWEFRHYVHPTAVPRVTRVWLFQATERYNLVKELGRLSSDQWTVGRNRDNLRPGNIALLWQSGENAGIYGIGELASRVTDEDDEALVDIRYTKLLERPVFKSELRKHPLLKKFGVIAMPRGKNPFRVLDKEWEALKELSSELLGAGAAVRS